MNVLFVCLGNICRSPLAEGILKDKLEKRRLEAHVDSVGTADYHVGEPADPRSSQIAAEHGISLADHRGRQFTTDDFDTFDKIYVMDASNYANVLELARDESDAAKVDFVLNMAEPGSDKAVPDPYYGGRDGFRNVYAMLDAACEKIADEVEEFKNSRR